METLLMTPGPTNIPEEVMSAMSANMHHRTEQFKSVYLRVNEKLKKVFGTQNEVIVLLSSGTGGLEASIVNLFSPGDKLLVINCGVFGKRYADIARIYGVDVHEKQIEWGYGIRLEELENELKHGEYKAVYATYSETSTGVKNNIKEIGRLVKKYDSLFIVDIVSALGSLEFSAEDCHVDVAVAGSQKGLMCPPGLSLISVSDEAWRAVESSRIPKFYFDFNKYRGLEMPYTPGVSLLLGLDRSLEMIESEGMENVIVRHGRHSRAVKHGCSVLGLHEFPSEEFHSEVLTAVYLPEGISDKDIVEGMYKRGIVIAGGQGKLKGRIIRIGHMGYVKDEFIIRTMGSLCDTLHELGYKCDRENITAEIKKTLEVQI